MNRKSSVTLTAVMLLAGGSTVALAQSASLSGVGGSASPPTATSAQAAQLSAAHVGTRHVRLMNSARCRGAGKIGTRGAANAESSHQKGC